LENLDDYGISRAWKNIRQNIRLQPQSAAYYKPKQHFCGLMKHVQNFYISGSRLNCRAQAKQMEIT
jgi:hypothetical protein